MPLKPVLITGVNGFVGQYLARHLSSLDREVTGIDVHEKSVMEGIRYFQTDICEIECIKAIFQKVQPVEIYHLAAMSSPLECQRRPITSFQINLMGTISLFEAMKDLDHSAIMLAVGSAKQYQSVGYSGKLLETSDLAPNSYYGVSKNAVEMIAHFYINHHNLDIRLTRSFNHTGPGQATQFVCSDWAHQIASIVSQKASPRLSVGNINSVMDFSDVRDIVEAYHLIVERGKKGEVYNVCSGKGTPLKYILDYLIAKSSLANSISVRKEKVDTNVSNKELIGDNNKIHNDTGWRPKIPIEKTLDDLYNWWLEKLNKS